MQWVWRNDKGQTMQWRNGKGQTMQWRNDKGQTMQWRNEKQTIICKSCPIPFNVFK